MSLYDLFPNEEASQTDEGLRATPQPPPGAPWYAGMLTAPLSSGVGGGVAKMIVGAEGGEHMPMPPPIGAPAWAYEAYERQFKPAENLTPEQREQRANAATAAAVKEFTPDPRTTGWVGQTLAGLADVGTRATVGGLVGGPGGAALAVSTSSGITTLRNEEAQGVDSATAHRMAAWDSLTSGAALITPFGVGKQLLTKLVTGATTNVAFGMADRYVNGKILDDAGYKAMAEQYHVLDKQAILTDALMGTFFGGGAYLHDRMSAAGKGLPPAVGDVALASADQLHVENSANGIPKTPEARDDHVDNFEEALKAAMDDREPIGMKDVETVPNPAQDAATSEAAREVDSAVRETLGEPVEPEAVLETEAFHGTIHPFTDFETVSGLGPHFGSAEQANIYGASVEGGNIHPVVLNLRNALRTDHLSWDFAVPLAAQLRDAGILPDIIDKLPNWNPEGMSKADEKTAFGVIRKELLAKGIDSIVYRDKLDKVGTDSYISLKPNEQVRSKFSERPEPSKLGRSARAEEAAKAEETTLSTLDPDAQETIAAAQKHLDENPDTKIVNPNTEEGEVGSGKDMLKDATDDIDNGKVEGELSQVLAACSLREG